ncbi:MAG TPA: prenyltransferase [bacterium]|nr:prenyltransferase [bacterium]HQG46514.1 prenyltransferase [bacterium]HQI48519.1 prenyltransferase [bacterium]HQJ64064.1 prenyltransferase [bacterium]
MVATRPGLFALMRAPFFSSILAPLCAGTLLAVIASGHFSPAGFAVVLVMGVALHAATNVYNDIFDTLQGTDRINLHRNEFSGGSGFLLEHPDLLPGMYRVARFALIVAGAAVLLLLFLTRKNLWPWLAGLYLLSAFFSKYYTAAPVKLAYRGFGEVAVWFAFGPMAILVAAISQNILFHPYLLTAMPVTGLSTASILWMGQLIDLQADYSSGKHGLVARLGSRRGRWGLLLIHLLLIVNLLILAMAVLPHGWPLLAALLPYALLPRTWQQVARYHDQPEELKTAACWNVQIHLGMSALLVLGLLAVLILQ